jgi:LuxR family maltose regulon positive regulatory protein
MKEPLLKTKLYIPPPRAKDIQRSILINRLNEGLALKVSLISAPAGFGKTTLVSSWAAVCNRPVAWLSLNEMDNDPINFLIYLIAAIQTIDKSLGEQVRCRVFRVQHQAFKSKLHRSAFPQAIRVIFSLWT